MKKKNVLVAIATLGMFAVTACGTPKTEEAEEVTTEEVVEEVVVVETPNIVGVASANENFSTLVAAVTAAGLVETLNSEGPFTVFAPTNIAFSDLPAGTVETLLEPENKATLSGILTYHVVSGTIMAADLLKMIEEGKGKTTFSTVNGAQLTAMLVDGKVMIKDATGATATVAITDVKQSNGVVHVIDKVLLPSK